MNMRTASVSRSRIIGRAQHPVTGRSAATGQEPHSFWLANDATTATTTAWKDADDHVGYDLTIDHILTMHTFMMS